MITNTVALDSLYKFDYIMISRMICEIIQAHLQCGPNFQKLPFLGMFIQEMTQAHCQVSSTCLAKNI